MATQLGDPTTPKDIVYIVSEDSGLTSELRGSINSHKYCIETYTNCQEFESACRAKKPDVILFDVDSPESTEISDYILNLQAGAAHQPPVIAIGNSNQIEQRLHAARCNASRYMTTPINPVRLLHSIDDLAESTRRSAFRILLIDDEVEILTCYSEVLNKAGMVTQSLDEPYKALSMLETFQPDLVLLDLHMPDLSGFELGKVIRQDYRHDHIPIVFLSSETNIEQQQEVFSFGADGFVTKPLKNSNIFVSEIRARARRARRSKRISDNYMSALQESHSRQEVIDRHAIVSITDTHGDIIYVNQKSCEVSGYETDEQIGKNRRMHSSGHHPRSFYEEMWASLKTGKIWSGTFCNRHKNGGEYWLESTIVPFLDEKRTPYQYVSASTDITVMKSNEERLRRSQVFANIGTWDWDIKTGNIFWSECVSEMLGCEKPELQQTPERFINSMYEGDRKKSALAIENCIERGESYNTEYRVIWPDGSSHWIHEKGDVLRDENTGEPLRMLGIVQDISERKALEKELSRYKSAMNASMYAMAILNLDETFRYINPAWAKLHGYSNVDDIQNKNWKMLVPVDTHAQYSDEIFPALETTGHWQGESMSIKRDGTCFKQRLSLDVLGKIGIVCTIQDITIEKQNAEILQNAARQAEKENREKSNFISSMSHELRTPLNAILGFGQLLQLEADAFSEGPIKEYTDEIINAGNHLLTLIKEILDLSKIEAGNIEPEIQPIPLIDLIVECISLLTPLAAEHNIKIILKSAGSSIPLTAEEHTSLYCNADPTLTKQALINLIGNAIKYNRENGNIAIECDVVPGEKIRISIKDTGYGLSKSQQSKLFQPFQRLIPEHKRSSIEGTGIGLTITKSLVELMHGSIGFASQPTKGSTFWIELPQANLIDHSKTNNQASPGKIELIPTTSSDRTYSILYIEDNAANLRLVQGLLGHRKNLSLITANEPLSGLDLAKKQVPDLILLDINLPKMNGFQVLEKLSQHQITKAIPVIAVSANAMPEEISKALEAGFYSYVTKPIDFSTMIKSIEGALQG
ncbi:MAG: response regulator [Proteobacteria bacterium]|nr:response regulator [Pseudomonadota bacterium]